MKANDTDPAHEFVQGLRKLAHRHSREAFRRFCELSAIALANSLGNAGASPKDDAWNKREARYLEIVKAYTKEDLEVFAGMSTCVVRGLDFTARRESHDFLGHIFMQQLVGGRKGGWDSDLCFTSCRKLSRWRSWTSIIWRPMGIQKRPADLLSSATTGSKITQPGGDAGHTARA
ncbi:MAG: hypothetical protein ACRD2O_14225 [Terriglobia bacterium]